MNYHKNPQIKKEVALCKAKFSNFLTTTGHDSDFSNIDYNKDKEHDGLGKDKNSFNQLAECFKTLSKEIERQDEKIKKLLMIMLY